MEEKQPLTEASPQPTLAVTPKKKKGKKRRISKHIAEAVAKKNNKAPNNVDDETPKNNTSTGTADAAKNPVVVQKNKRRKMSAVKDPAEAAAYLVAWQKQQQKQSKGGSESSSSCWKFNKNTQSWLIRHMYEADKVSKGNFLVMLDYLKAGDQNTIQRCREDATRRALRYQKLSGSSAPSTTEDVDKSPEVAATKPADGVDGAVASRPAEDEEERWNKLGEHEKRKEYKRAHKVLEQLLLK